MRLQRIVLDCAAVFALGFFAGCAGTARDAVPFESQHAGSAARSFMTPEVRASGAQLVYLSAFVAGTVYVYDQGGKSQQPIGQIGGLQAPAGLAVTSKGDLYVASQLNGTVSAFHQGATTPFKVLTGGASLRGVAVDAKGTVYANNGFSNQIYVWAHGSTSPSETLTAAFTDDCDYVALDANGNLFVDSIFGEFEEFPKGKKTPIKLFTSNAYTSPFGMAFDAAGDLITAWSGGAVVTYTPAYNGTTLGTFKYGGLIYAVALAKSGKTLWAGNMTGPGATVGQSYGLPKGKLLDSTSSIDIADDSILGVATYPPALK